MYPVNNFHTETITFLMDYIIYRLYKKKVKNRKNSIVSEIKIIFFLMALKRYLKCYKFLGFVRQRNMQQPALKDVEES